VAISLSRKNQKYNTKESTSPGYDNEKDGKSVFADFSRKRYCNFFRDRLKLI